jgi:hypothetical protein
MRKRIMYLVLIMTAGLLGHFGWLAWMRYGHLIVPH